MSFEFVSVDDAIARRGVRIVLLGNVPSPWGEAAKGIFHIKRVPFAVVRLARDSEKLAAWTRGDLSAPVVIHEDDAPIAGWKEIAELAERLAPEPRLLPAEPGTRSRVLEISGKFCNMEGLGWSRRLQAVHAGLQRTGGFTNDRVAGFLGRKYGYDPARAGLNEDRLVGLLGELAARLRAGRAEGDYYLGKTLSIADVYSATFTGLFHPLPHDECPMDPGIRQAFEWLDDRTRAALDPILLEHRDMMYARHLELPIRL